MVAKCVHMIAARLSGMAAAPQWQPIELATRVFYQRRWRDPSGREFGKRTLRVTTANAFTRMLHGYRYSYKIEDSANG